MPLVKAKLCVNWRRLGHKRARKRRRITIRSGIANNTVKSGLSNIGNESISDGH